MKMAGKRWISMLLALVMLFTMMPFTAQAASQTVEITVFGEDGQPASGAWVNIYGLYNQQSNYDSSANLRPALPSIPHTG